MNRHFLQLCLIVIFVCVMSFGVHSKVYALQNLHNIQGLSVSVEYAKQDDGVWAVVWLNIQDNHYTYAPLDIPDDSVKPVVVNIYNNDETLLPVRYPFGVNRKDFYDVSKIIAGYSNETPIFVFLGHAASDVEFKGTLSLLLCSATRCLPVNLPLSLKIPHELTSLSSQKYYDIWKKSVVREQAEDAVSRLGVQSLGLQSLGDNVQLSSTSKTYNWAFAPRIFAQELEVSSLDKALLFGFLAGIILNLMPCVFPVLTLKASSFLSARQGLENKDFREFRLQNILFAAGMLTLFLLLAIFLGTAGFIWGQFYQNTAFVAFMVVLIFALALSMFGLYNLPMIDLKAGSVKSPRMQAYLTGMVTTILATPCSGPLLGGVLSYAFTQPLEILIMIFVAVGLGMSTPYLLLALNPQLARFLPRPGNWMSIIEKIVAFFLLATALYLLSILPQDVHITMLMGLVVVAFMGWLWGTFGGLNASKGRRTILSTAFIVCIAIVVFYVSKPQAYPTEWEYFNAESFQRDLGKVPMLVEFTADWCPNCKFVEKTVLTSEFLEQIKKDYNVKLVKVDITRHNPQAESLLQALGSSSIPLTAIFTTGLQASAPVILRDIYTKNMLEQALEQAF